MENSDIVKIITDIVQIITAIVKIITIITKEHTEKALRDIEECARCLCAICRRGKCVT